MTAEKMAVTLSNALCVLEEQDVELKQEIFDIYSRIVTELWLPTDDANWKLLFFADRSSIYMETSYRDADTGLVSYFEDIGDFIEKADSLDPRLAKAVLCIRADRLDEASSLVKILNRPENERIDRKMVDQMYKKW